MNRNTIFLIAVLALASTASAGISMTYPVESNLQSGDSVPAGFVGPGQTFDLVFSNDSGYGYNWDTIEVLSSSLPRGWKVVTVHQTDPSIGVSISVPSNAVPNVYVLRVMLSSSVQATAAETVDVRVIVKNGLLDVSFARKSTDEFAQLGGKVIYNVKLTNSSIAPFGTKITSNLPSNWFSEKPLLLKANTTQDLELAVTPLSSGKFDFAFQAFESENNIIVQSYSSELNVRPTLKGKFGSAFSGFPFFTFTLLPFQLFDSFFSFVLP